MWIRHEWKATVPIYTTTTTTTTTSAMLQGQDIPFQDIVHAWMSSGSTVCWVFSKKSIQIDRSTAGSLLVLLVTRLVWTLVSVSFPAGMKMWKLWVRPIPPCLSWLRSHVKVRLRWGLCKLWCNDTSGSDMANRRSRHHDRPFEAVAANTGLTSPSWPVKLSPVITAFSDLNMTDELECRTHVLKPFQMLKLRPLETDYIA